MTRLHRMEHDAVKYVRNTGGNATKANFVEDHAPIGELLWKNIAPYVQVNAAGRIALTIEGAAYLEEHK